MKYELRNSRTLVLCDVRNNTNIYFSNCAELWLIITIWHIFSAEASCCHKMKFFRNSIRNATYSAPNFIEWFTVKDFNINVKYCDSHKFCFFIKTKKMIFLEVTMTMIGEDTSTKCLQCINMMIHKESHSCEKMWFYTYFLKNRSFCQIYPQIFTLMQL